MTEETEITFSELDRLCDLDPLGLSDVDLDRLILGMRAYRNNALAKGAGKATKFTEEAGIKIDVRAMGLVPKQPAIKRRI